MRAGTTAPRSDGKTLAERLAEARSASNKQMALPDDRELDEAAELAAVEAMDPMEADPDIEPAEEAPAAFEAEPQPEPEMQPEPEPRRAATPAASDDTDAIVQAAKAARQARGGAAGVPRRVCLVVDDSRVVRKLTSKVASSLGYHVVEAENGEEALARCRKEMPDLVLTDWSMPVMTGLEFVTALRAMPATKEPAVMFCTSKGDAEDIHTGINAGADDYIVKPFAEDALKAKLVKLGVA